MRGHTVNIKNYVCLHLREQIEVPVYRVMPLLLTLYVIASQFAILIGVCAKEQVFLVVPFDDL
jgi:hypothetical protein